MAAAAHSAYFVVQTRHQREFVARDALRDAGFNCYLPRYIRRTRHSGRYIRTPQPLFSQYLFVLLPLVRVPNTKHRQAGGEWRRINSQRGVDRLLCSTAESPLPVPGDVIRAIRAREDDDGYVRLGDLPEDQLQPEPPSYQAGQPVRVTRGAYAGSNALFSLDAGERVTVMLRIFGRDTPTILPRDWIAAA